MKGTPHVIEALQKNLADESAAGQQYLAHKVALENIGLFTLAALVADRAADEARHAYQLATRLLELETSPEVWKLGKIETSVTDPGAIIAFDNGAELRAVSGYTEAAKLAEAAADYRTADIFRKILAEEVEHQQELQGWLDQIALMSLPLFLSTMNRKA